MFTKYFALAVKNFLYTFNDINFRVNLTHSKLPKIFTLLNFFT